MKGGLMPEGTIHDNSRAAQETYRDRLSRREQLIYNYLLSVSPRPLSDRQVKINLFGAADMNMVRPRITTLIQNGWLEEVDSVKSQTTKTLGRRTRARTAGERLAYLASKAEWEQPKFGGMEGVA